MRRRNTSLHHYELRMELRMTYDPSTPMCGTIADISREENFDEISMKDFLHCLQDIGRRYYENPLLSDLSQCDTIEAYNPAVRCYKWSIAEVDDSGDTISEKVADKYIILPHDAAEMPKIIRNWNVIEDPDAVAAFEAAQDEMCRVELHTYCERYAERYDPESTKPMDDIPLCVLHMESRCPIHSTEGKS